MGEGIGVVFEVQPVDDLDSQPQAFVGFVYLVIKGSQLELFGPLSRPHALAYPGINLIVNILRRSDVIAPFAARGNIPGPGSELKGHGFIVLEQALHFDLDLCLASLGHGHVSDIRLHWGLVVGDNSLCRHLRDGIAVGIDAGDFQVAGGVGQLQDHRLGAFHEAVIHRGHTDPGGWAELAVKGERAGGCGKVGGGGAAGLRLVVNGAVSVSVHLHFENQVIPFLGISHRTNDENVRVLAVQVHYGYGQVDDIVQFSVGVRKDPGTAHQSNGECFLPFAAVAVRNDGNLYRMFPYSVVELIRRAQVKNDSRQWNPFEKNGFIGWQPLVVGAPCSRIGAAPGSGEYADLIRMPRVPGVGDRDLCRISVVIRDPGGLKGDGQYQRGLGISGLGGGFLAGPAKDGKDRDSQEDGARPDGAPPGSGSQPTVESCRSGSHCTVVKSKIDAGIRDFFHRGQTENRTAIHRLIIVSPIIIQQNQV